MRTVFILTEHTEILVTLRRVAGFPGEEVAFVGDTPFALVQRLPEGKPRSLVVRGIRGGVAIGAPRRVAALLGFAWGCFLRQAQ